MRYLRIEADDETRWINLDQVTRATLARHAGSGHELLAVFFTNPGSDCTLKIDGDSKKNTAAIRALVAAFDAAARTT